MPIDKIQGADNPALEAKIKEHYEAVGWDGETQSGVKVIRDQHDLHIHSIHAQPRYFLHRE